MAKTKVVLYWVDEQKASIEDLAIINEEDRYVPAPTSVKIGNKYHKAIVRMISSDTLKLEAEEEKVCDEKQQKEKEDKDRRGRNNRHRRTNSGAASANQVASAMGERLKPTAEQATKAKELALVKKTAEAAQKAAQADVDRQVMEELLAPAGRKEGSSSAKRKLDLGEDHHSDKAADSESDGLGFSDDDDSDNVQVEASASTSACCSHCKDLQISYKHSPVLFKALERFVNFASKSEGGIQYLDILPVPEDTPKTEISKGSGVWMSVSDKNTIRRDGEGDPAKMTRMALVYLFGRDTLEAEQVTAKGTKKGSKGIRNNVLNAIKSFVNRNKSAEHKDVTDAALNRIINKKKGQLHRVARTPSNSQKKTQNTSKKSKPQKTPLKTPVKTPTKAALPSPAKCSSVRSPSKLMQSKSPRQTLWSPTQGLLPLQALQAQASPYNSAASYNNAAVSTSFPSGFSSNFSPFQQLGEGHYPPQSFGFASTSSNSQWLLNGSMLTNEGAGANLGGLGDAPRLVQ